MSAHALAIGSSLAGYTLREQIGEGGTSVVYRAEHPDHGQVALKILKEKLRQDRTAVARFLREAELGERVKHPNVVRTIELGEAPGGVRYLATEWVNGELLERYMRRHAPLPREDVAHIVTQIADAVHAVHEAGIVHRDLKPDNLMYDPATGQVKLLDFGIAAATDTTPDERLTRAGFFVGTLMYVAPEALSGELVTEAADQYSLATIAYFLLTGCLPYAAKSPREMFTQLLSLPPTPLNRAKPGVQYAPSIEQVVMRALAKSPAERYADVETFARELAHALTHENGEEGESGGLFAKVRKLFRS
ncbi:MAG TPA: serine/threonine-protein kinase [Gemmatimonadaceae bacterium]|nr:serine/threonine-protein kinase [Gemmatimonadaceae bacterium]